MEAENKLEEDTQYYMEIKNNYCDRVEHQNSSSFKNSSFDHSRGAKHYLYTFKISFKELTYSAPY